MVSISPSASQRHPRQFTMRSPSALPMNANNSESKRGIIISSERGSVCTLSHIQGFARERFGMACYEAGHCEARLMRMLQRRLRQLEEGLLPPAETPESRRVQ